MNIEVLSETDDEEQNNAPRIAGIAVDGSVNRIKIIGKYSSLIKDDKPIEPPTQTTTSTSSGVTTGEGGVVVPSIMEVDERKKGRKFCTNHQKQS